MSTSAAGEAAERNTPTARTLLPFQIVMTVVSGAISGIVALLGDLRDELGFSETSIGIIVTTGFLAAFVAQAGFAQHADRGRARAMTVVGITLAAVALLSMTLVDNVTAWTLSRALLGFGGGLVLPGIRRAATVIDPKNAGQNLGRLVAAEVLGFLIGPLLAALLASAFGLRAPFLVLGVGLALFLPFALRLPDDNGARDTSGRRSSVDLLRGRRLQGALMLVSGYFMLIGSFNAVIPVMFKDRGGGSIAVGLAFTLLAIPIVLVSPHAGRVADRVGPPRVATAGIAVVALSAAFYGLLPGIVLPVIVMVVVGVADGFGFTAAQVSVSRAVPEERQAGALGLMGATEVLAAGLAAAPAAILYDASGARVTWLAVSAATLCVVGLAQLRLRGTAPSHAAGTDVDWTPLDRHPSPEPPPTEPTIATQE